jgi:hypothetical protein
MEHLHNISSSDQATLSAVALEHYVANGLRHAKSKGDTRIEDPSTGSCLGHFIDVEHDDGLTVCFEDGSLLVIRAESM